MQIKRLGDSQLIEIISISIILKSSDFILKVDPELFSSMISIS
jgi:hypothetical protein